MLIKDIRTNNENELDIELKRPDEGVLLNIKLYGFGKTFSEISLIKNRNTYVLKPYTNNILCFVDVRTLVESIIISSGFEVDLEVRNELDRFFSQTFNV